MNKTRLIHFLLGCLIVSCNHKNQTEVGSSEFQNTLALVSSNTKANEDTLQNSVNTNRQVVTIKQDTISNNEHKNVKELALTAEEKKIANVAMSFHNWYIPVTNSGSDETPFTYTVKKGEKDSCIVDFAPYFDQLRQLGTISEAFIKNEKDRMKLCTETISMMKYSEYIGTIPEHCDDFLYWTNSQDETDGVEIKKIRKTNANWIVTISLFIEYEGKRFETNHAHVTVINENNKHMIYKITMVDKV